MKHISAKKYIATALILLSFMTTCLIGCGNSGKSNAPKSDPAADTMDSEQTSTDANNDTDSDGQTSDSTGASDPSIQYAISSFPTIKSDVPDPDIIRVGENYYMVSTTMNMCPGIPIMKSTDLVHWAIVNYVYDVFENDDITNLANGYDMYSRGSWAASLKFDEQTGLYYVGFTSNNHGFYIYTTDDIENGYWTKYHGALYFHDPALFFEDGKMYVISASGGNCNITQIELTDNYGMRSVGDSKTLFKAKNWGLWEGAHAYKIGDYYYVFIIASPTNRWIRTQVCYRSRDLMGTDWEEKTLYMDGVGSSSAGLAQGGVVDTVNGDWYAFLFQDAGSLGRSPSIINVVWDDNWPLMGVLDINGKFVKNAMAMTIKLPVNTDYDYIVGDDEFDYPDTFRNTADRLKLVWQFNHNPQNNYWSVTDRPGFYTITTNKVVNNVWEASNSLTQRTLAKNFESETLLYTDNMNPGDYAGICSVADHYGMIGVMCDSKGKRYIYQANGQFKEAFETPNAIVDTPLEAGQPVYLKIVYEIKGQGSDNAAFYYSLDGETWNALGNKQTLGFSTATTFMGTRTWLFNYATKKAGGHVDFDYYHCR